MKERYTLAGRSNQQLFDSFSWQNINDLALQPNVDKKYLQALRLLQPGARLGAVSPYLESVESPDRRSLIARAVRTASENGGKDFAVLSIEERAQFCVFLAHKMSTRSRQEAAAKRYYGTAAKKSTNIPVESAVIATPVTVFEQQQTIIPEPEIPSVAEQQKPGNGRLNRLKGRLTSRISNARKVITANVQVGLRIGLAALAISASTPAINVFAASNLEPGLSDSIEVPTMQQGDFTKWSSQFPQATRRSLQDIVTENKEFGFDGRVASELVLIEQLLNSRKLSFSLSPNIVKEAYGKYIAACENDEPDGNWREIITRVVQGYSDEIRVVVDNFDWQSIRLTQAQPAENANVVVSKTPEKPVFSNRKPNPDFAGMLKRSVIIEDAADFDQTLILYGYNQEEINRIHESMKIIPGYKFDSQNSSISRAYILYDLLRTAAKRKIALSETQLKAGLKFVEANPNLFSLDVIDKFLDQLS